MALKLNKQEQEDLRFQINNLLSQINSEIIANRERILGFSRAKQQELYELEEYVSGLSAFLQCIESSNTPFQLLSIANRKFRNIIK